MPDGTALPVATRQADQKFCFSCGRLLHVTAAGCPACGASQMVASPQARTGLAPAQSMFCYGCGAQIHRAAYACPACGAAQRGGQVQRAGKDRTTAIVLAFLLGGIGVHRFYLGHVWIGLLYLVFCWTLIPALIATVEGILFISTSDLEFQCKYGEYR